MDHPLWIGPELSFMYYTYSIYTHINVYIYSIDLYPATDPMI